MRQGQAERREAQRYLDAKPVLEEMRQYRRYLTLQEMRTFKGQALAGDVDGAMIGLQRLLGARVGMEALP